MALIVILAVTLVSGILPTKLVAVDAQYRDKILSYFSFFTGGVFLGAGLLHMLPDAQEALEGEKFPWVFLASCCGFITVWSVDKVELGVNTASEPTVAHQREIVAVAAGAQDGKGAVICAVTIPTTTVYGGDKQRLSQSSTDQAALGYDSFQNSNHNLDEGLKHRHERTPSVCYSEETFTHGHSHSSPHTGHAHADHEKGHSSNSHAHNHDHGPALHDHEHANGHHHHVVISGTDSMLPFILALVFSVHSFVAGLALGVQSGADASAISILVAILSHKVVEAVTVGTNFVKQKVELSKAIPVILVYCFMTPLGILTGMLLTKLISGQRSVYFQAMAQAFASGSFIYLAMHEISDPNCCHHVKAYQQIGLLCSGVLVMALIAVWV
jgi:zinc transporter 1/2/3